LTFRLPGPECYRQKQMKPKILIDARMIVKKNHGIGLYAAHLASAMRQLKTHNDLPYEITFLISTNCSNIDIFSEFKTIVSRVGFLSPIELVSIPFILKSFQFSGYHSPSFSSLIACPIPYAITIHDLNHLKFGTTLQKLYYSKILKPFAMNAHSLLTVSRFSKSEIQTWIGDPEINIEIVYNPVTTTPDPVRPTGSHDLKHRNFFLAVLNEKKHKNAPLLLDAHQSLPESIRSNWPLVMTIAGESTNEVKYLDTLSTAELAWLYQNAAALFSPSFYEGFGRPPVEAILYGTAAVVSDIPPHHEGLESCPANSVRYCDPYKKDDWSDAMSLVSAGGLTQPLKPFSQHQRNRFSEEEMAKRMDRVYRSMLLH